MNYGVIKVNGTPVQYDFSPPLIHQQVQPGRHKPEIRPLQCGPAEWTEQLTHWACPKEEHTGGPLSHPQVQDSLRELWLEPLR